MISAPYAYTPELARRFVKLVLSTLFFVVTFNLVTDAQWLVRNLRALIVSGSVAAGLGLMLWAQSPERQVALLSRLQVLGYPSGQEVLRFLPGPNDTYTNIVRATGTSIDPNVFAGMLLMIARRPAGTAIRARDRLPARLALARRWWRAAHCHAVARHVAGDLWLPWAGSPRCAIAGRGFWASLGAIGLSLTPFGQGPGGASDLRVRGARKAAGAAP